MEEKTLCDEIKALLKSRNIKYYNLTDSEELITLTFLCGYRPYIYPEECYKIDAYYTVSNRAYGTEKELIALLSRYGIKSDIHKAHDLRAVAQRALLGKRALSGFIYNDDYGTYCFIGCIDIDKCSIDNSEELSRLLTLSSLPKLTKSCDGCERCKKACPSGAVPDRKELCLRNIQENARKELTDEQRGLSNKLGERLLGCDICQRACPINTGITPIYPPVALTTFLNKENILNNISNGGLNSLKEIIGTNYARKSVMLSILELLTQNKDDKEN